MDLDLNTIWFILVGILFTGYAMLDGFDLGVGALHLFTKKDEHTPDLERSMDIRNSASTEKTLFNMLIVAILGVPIVLAYTVSVYWIFRGKAEITEDSY